ncbi:MAG: hypothetical protein ACYSTY_11605, partial [Planctomycetota bacterium]
DGSQRAINRLYSRYNRDFPDEDAVAQCLDEVLRFIDQTFKGVILGTPIAKPPHFLLLFAAVAHALHGIPAGGLGDELPSRDAEVLADFEQAQENLATIAARLEAGQARGRLATFVEAAKVSMLSVANRAVRFAVFWQALLPQPLDG